MRNDETGRRGAFDGGQARYDVRSEELDSKHTISELRDFVRMLANWVKEKAAKKQPTSDFCSDDGADPLGL